MSAFLNVEGNGLEKEKLLSLEKEFINLIKYMILKMEA